MVLCYLKTIENCYNKFFQLDLEFVIVLDFDLIIVCFLLLCFVVVALVVYWGFFYLYAQRDRQMIFQFSFKIPSNIAKGFVLSIKNYIKLSIISLYFHLSKK